MKINSSQRELLKLLQDKEANGEPITKKDILKRTGWKEASFRTYWSKGQLSDFLNEIGDDLYEASNSVGLTVIEFTKMLSQSKHRRGLGHNCKSRLAKSLLKKSKDNMLLALELYNRPSLENRMDGFVVCFCIAWEQLLKALLIEKNGEDSIFKKGVNSKGQRVTISLRECLDKLFKSGNIVRKNIERIAAYRDQSVHLLMPEVQGILWRLFQSGILNYSTEFSKFTEQDFLNASHSGMLSLVGDLREPSIALLKTNYGEKIGEEIFQLVKTITKEAKETNNINFAIPLEVVLVFAKKDSNGNIISIANAGEGVNGLEAMVIEKTVDHSTTHPFTEKKCIIEINKRLRESYPVEFLKERLVAKHKTTNMPEINFYCFRAIVDKKKWKNGDNKYHFKDKNLDYHIYSELVIEEFIELIKEDSNFVKNAREKYSHKLKRKKVKS